MSVTAAPAERPGFVGPIFFWELIRQSRKGRGHFPRLIFAAAMLVVLYMLLGSSEITQKNAAYLSEQALYTYLIVQYASILILTPFSVAGAFIEERQQHTLQLLLTTFLTPREFILGKMNGRLVHVAAALLAGLPILALLQLLGGVNVTELLLHTSLALVLMLICGMYAIRASTLCKTVGGAIMMTYGMLIGGYLLASVISIPTMIFYLASNFAATSGVGHVVIWVVSILILNFIFALFALRNAIRSIKIREKDQDYGSLQFMEDNLALDSQKRVMVVETPVRQPVVIQHELQSATVHELRAAQRIHWTIRWKRLPPVGDRPFLWKETYFPLSDADALLAGICCGLPLTVFLTSFVNADTFRSVQPFMVWCAQAMMMLVLVLTTLRASGTFSQERIQQTLLSLLSVPISTWGLVAQAWLGSIRRYRACVIGTALVALTTIAYTPVGTLFLIGAFATQVAFFTMLGTMLSMWRMTPFQARFLVGTCFFASLFVVPAFLRGLAYHMPFSLTMLLCPYLSWDLINDRLFLGALVTNFDGLPTRRSVTRIVEQDYAAGLTVLGGMFVMLVLTSLLYVAAVYRLRRMQERLS